MESQLVDSKAVLFSLGINPYHYGYGCFALFPVIVLGKVKLRELDAGFLFRYECDIHFNIGLARIKKNPLGAVISL